MSPQHLHWGLHLPNYGEAWGAPGLGDMAVLVEQAGFDSVWLSDHVVLVEDVASRYPFSADGSFFLPADQDWLEWTTVAGYLAARTSRVEIGVGVCVLPLRHPLLLAKQVATLDRLSGGRIVLGAGAGWMAEEFSALGLDFGARGAATDGGLTLLRAAWEALWRRGSTGPTTCRPGSTATRRRSAPPSRCTSAASPAPRSGASPTTGRAGRGPRSAAACRCPGRRRRPSGSRRPAGTPVVIRPRWRSPCASARPRASSARPGCVTSCSPTHRRGGTRFSFDLAWPGPDVMPDRLAALRQTTHDVQAQLAPTA